MGLAPFGSRRGRRGGLVRDVVDRVLRGLTEGGRREIQTEQDRGDREPRLDGLERQRNAEDEGEDLPELKLHGQAALSNLKVATRLAMRESAKSSHSRSRASFWYSGETP